MDIRMLRQHIKPKFKAGAALLGAALGEEAKKTIAHFFEANERIVHLIQKTFTYVAQIGSIQSFYKQLMLERAFRFRFLKSYFDRERGFLFEYCSKRQRQHASSPASANLATYKKVCKKAPVLKPELVQDLLRLYSTYA